MTQCNTTESNPKQNKPMQSNTDQYNPTQSNAKQHRTQICTKHDKAMQSLTNTTQRNSAQSDAEQHTAVQGNTMAYKATKVNAKQHKAI